MHPLSNERGSSLVGIIVSLGAIGIAFGVMARFQVSSLSMKKNLRSKQSYRQVESNLISVINEALDKAILGSTACIDTSTWLNDTDFLNPAQSPFGFNKSHPTLNATKTRCSQPSIVNNNTTGGTFNFCIKIQRDPTEPRDSILNSEANLIEIKAQLVNLHTMAPITCETYRTKKNDPADVSAGMTIGLRTFWETKTRKSFRLHRKTTSALANEN